MSEISREQKIDNIASKPNSFVHSGGQSRPSIEPVVFPKLVHEIQQSAQAESSSPVKPNAKQQQMIDAACGAASIRTQIARRRASGLDGDVWLKKATDLAKIKFNLPNPDMEQISGILGSMAAGLINANVMIAGTDDPLCSTLTAYVRGSRAPIFLCSAFFAASDEWCIRIMVHEIAHTRGIGKGDEVEEYVMTFDCYSPGTFESADAWSNFVHCLSGQPPDVDEKITGNRPRK